MSQENSTEKLPQVKVTLYSEEKEIPLVAEVAFNDADRTKGLMGRTSLPENEGMLFIFENPHVLKFWMKDTLIPLDMLFFDEAYRIVSIAKNATPCNKEESCPIYDSKKNAQYVLEVQAGFADKHSLQEGDSIFWEDL